ncbi:MAG: hypothetical protein AAFY41_11720 [Bacteroidota bacterium]
MKILLNGLFLLIFCFGFSQSREIPYTQDDRDRMIRLEEKVAGMEQSLNAKIEGIDKSLNAKIDLVEKNINTRMNGIESKLDFISNLLLVLITSMFGFVVLLVWDRKTTLKPVRKSQDELIDILRQYAKEKDDKVLKKLLDKAAMF